MPLEVRPGTAVALLFGVLLLVVGSSVAAPHVLGVGEGPEPQVDMVELEDGTLIWPYTSRDTSYEQQTLAVNLLVYGDADVTEQLLRTPWLPDVEWEDIEEDEHDIAPVERGLNETGIGLGQADGAIRYTQVVTPDGDVHWLEESYQLKDGPYLGDRDHLRAYVDPEGSHWTAFQAHREHWDWFHLRHTVHSIEQSQQQVELEFVHHPFVESLVRERWGNDQSSDSDGWATVIRLDERAGLFLVSLLFVGAVGTARTRRMRETVTSLLGNHEVQQLVRGALLSSAIVTYYLLVRFGAIQAELLRPVDLNIKLIVALFYPLLVVGLPIIAYLGARQLESGPAFAAGSIGFIVALLFDYSYLGVTALPLDTVVHRTALALAIGCLCAGASLTARSPSRRHGYVRTGVLLWLVAIVLPLLQFVPVL